MGQTREVFVFRLVTLSGVEQLILDTANGKLDLDFKIIQAGIFNPGSFDESKEEGCIQDKISKWKSALSNSVKGEKATTDHELIEMLARNAEELERTPRATGLMTREEIPSWVLAKEIDMPIEEFLTRGDRKGRAVLEGIAAEGDLCDEKWLTAMGY